MKLARLTIVAALATSTSAASATGIALNDTDTTFTTRRLQQSPMSYRMRGIDIVGKDITFHQTPDPVSCFLHCLITPEPACGGATWTNYSGGTCWFKATGFKATGTAISAGADSFVIRTDATSVAIWSGTRDGFDMAGNDLTTTNRGTMRECMKDCEANKECYAVVWTNYADGTCWLKSRASAYVTKAGAKSAYVAKQYDIDP